MLTWFFEILKSDGKTATSLASLRFLSIISSKCRVKCSFQVVDDVRREDLYGFLSA